MRHIDHLVVAVRDLDRPAGVYRRLGFQVGARNRHPWGTENRLIQFATSFIELITVGTHAASIPPHRPRHFSFGAFVRDYLAEREGLAMLVLSSVDARADAARFAQSGIGDFAPFHFARAGQRLDGTETQVAFTLAFAADPGVPRAGFFVCQQHLPENFWDPRLQRHANGATNIAAVTLTAPAPDAHQSFLRRFCGAEPRRRDDGTWTVPVDGGRVDFAAAPGTQSPPLASARLTGATIEVADAEAAARVLTSAGIPFSVSDVGLAVAAGDLFGLGLRFATRGSG